MKTKETKVLCIKPFGMIKEGTVINGTLIEGHFNGTVIKLNEKELPFCTINPLLIVRKGEIVHPHFKLA